MPCFRCDTLQHDYHTENICNITIIYLFFILKYKCKHLKIYKLIKIGNKTVFKNNNLTMYDYSRKKSIYPFDLHNFWGNWRI